MKNKILSLTLIVSIMLSIFSQPVFAEPVVENSKKINQTVINLKGKSDSEVKKILEDLNLKYDSNAVYEDLVIENYTYREPKSKSKILGLFRSMTYKNAEYRIIYERKGLTIRTKSFPKVNVNSVINGLATDTMNVGIGLLKKVVWIPYTFLTGATKDQLKAYCLNGEYSDIAQMNVKITPNSIKRIFQFKLDNTYQTCAETEKLEVYFDHNFEIKKKNGLWAHKTVVDKTHKEEFADDYYHSGISKILEVAYKAYSEAERGLELEPFYDGGCFSKYYRFCNSLKN